MQRQYTLIVHSFRPEFAILEKQERGSQEEQNGPNFSFVAPSSEELFPSPGGPAVIKAQVLAGGRGMGHFNSGLQGGVKLADR